MFMIASGDFINVSTKIANSSSPSTIHLMVAEGVDVLFNFVSFPRNGVGEAFGLNIQAQRGS
jgi:hypothetical protein